MDILNWRKFSIRFRVLLILIFCLLFCSSISYANTFTLPLNQDTTTIAATLPEINQSTELIRSYDFEANTNVDMTENMGVTGSGQFTVNGQDKSSNSIIFNDFSGFIVSQTSTELNINNVTNTGAKSTIGSVIYNTISDAQITIDNCNFNSNSTLSQTSNALGGAIYSTGNLSIKNTSFVGNSAKTTSDGSEAKGGAIYARNSIEIIADSENVEIVDNYTEDSSGSTTDNAIYMDNSDSTLTINAKNNGTISIGDNIDGNNGYNTVLTGDGTGTIKLTNSINNSNITSSNVDISTINNEINDISVNNLTVEDNTNLKIDVDLSNSTSDTISSTNSNGTLNLSEINILNGTTADNVTVQILKTDNLSLNIDKLTAKVVSGVQATMYNNSIIADSINLATTDTANDSITINGYKDVLYEMVHDTEPTHMIKYFIFRTDSDYKLTKDLGIMSPESILTIRNDSGSEYGVLDAQNHSMFELNEAISTVTLENIEVKNASSSGDGAVASLTNTTSAFTATDSKIHDNTSSGNGGAIYAKHGQITLSNTDLTNNTAGGDGGAIYADEDTIVNLTNVNLTNNSSNGKGGAIYTKTDVSLTADGKTISLDGNTANGENNGIYVDSNNATVAITTKNKGEYIINDKIDGIEKYNLNFNGDRTGKIEINNTITNANTTLSGANLILSTEDLMSGNDFTTKGGSIDLINDQIGSTNFNKFSMSGNTKIKVNADLANKTMDRITADSYGSVSGILDVTKIKLLSDAKSPTTRIKFADSAIKNNVISSVHTAVYSKIYKYLVMYDKENGYFTFNRGDGDDANDYNPAVLPVGIAMQLGYVNALQNYDIAMYHSKTYMMLPRQVRASGGLNNRHASDFDDINNDSYIKKYLAIQEEVKTTWVIPYASFESIDLEHGPNVKTFNFGTLIGGDSDMYELGGGFKYVYSGFFGYNGNLASYKNVDSLQQGGVIGGTLHLYKGNFFNSLTASVGYLINNSDTEYGTDTMNIIMSGFSNRMGYNFEFASGKLIIQPSLTMGYTCVVAGDYTTSFGVRIRPEPLNVMHFSPAIKIIGNLTNGWQPYGVLRIMGNFLNETHFTADTVRVPEMSISPYVEYGFGIQKRWEDKFSGYAQATVRNGGRKGVSLLFGFRYMIGKIISREHFIIRENINKKKALFKERKEPEIEIITAKDKNKYKNAVPEQTNTRNKHNFNLIDGLKKIGRLVLFRYNTDVSAKVVTDVYNDGVIMTTLDGMDNKNKNASSDYKDRDLINRKYNIQKQNRDTFQNRLAPANQINSNRENSSHATSDKENLNKQSAQAVSVPKQEKVEKKPNQAVSAPKQDKVEKKPAQAVSTPKQEKVEKKPNQSVSVPKQDKVEKKPNQAVSAPKQDKVEKKPAQAVSAPKQEKVEKKPNQAVSAPKQEKVEKKPNQSVSAPKQEKIKQTTPAATVIKAPKRNIDIKPLNKMNKNNLYLNQNKVIRPYRANSYKDYSTEIVPYKF